MKTKANTRSQSKSNSQSRSKTKEVIELDFEEKQREEVKSFHEEDYSSVSSCSSVSSS